MWYIYTKINKKMVVSSMILSYVVYCVNTHGFTMHIRHPANAISSLSYALLDTNIHVQLPLFILSVASFNLWSNDTVYINLIDVTSIFWVTVIVTLHSIPNNRIILMIVNCLFVVYIVTVILLKIEKQVVLYYSDNIVVLNAIVYLLCVYHPANQL